MNETVGLVDADPMDIVGCTNHWYLSASDTGAAHTAAFGDLMRSAERSLGNTDRVQIVHRHQYKGGCEAGCRVIRQTKAVGPEVQTS